MQTIDQYLTSSQGAILLLGPPGVGKTTLATQLSRPYLLECDNNLKGPISTIRSNPGWSRSFRFDIPHIREDRTIVPRWERCERFTELANAAAVNETVDTIVIDGLTGLTDYIEDEVRKQNNKKIKGYKGATVTDPLSQPDWGTFGAIAKHIIIGLKSTGKLLVVTGHVESRQDINEKGDQRPMLKYLAFPGRLRETLAGFFDEVWYMHTATRTVNGAAKLVRFLKTAPNDYREGGLGLKTAIGLGLEFELDFDDLKKRLNQPTP